MPSAPAESGQTEAPPTVSIVVIFKDPGAFLSEAIDSVRAQTLTSWELLLVDDGSSDGSSDLAQALAAAEPRRVRYLEHDGHANRGMSASRNLGIAHAGGDFVAFLDADDELVATALEEAGGDPPGSPRGGNGLWAARVLVRMDRAGRRRGARLRAPRRGGHRPDLRAPCI